MIIQYDLNKLACEGRVSGFEIYKNQDLLTGDLILQLISTTIKKLEHSDSIKLTLDVPSSWWQHLKQDCFPVWYKKKWPVKYITKEKMFLFDLETVALVHYDYIKSIAAHQPFIRIACKEEMPTMWRDSTTGKFTNPNSAGHF